MPWAVIDIGTNSVRLLVADVRGGRVVPRLRALHQPRLGRGVDGSGRLDPAAAAATLAAVGDLASRAREAGSTSVTVVGTSALRDAADKQQFMDAVRREHGLDVTLLSGAAEAALSFYGAVRGVHTNAQDGVASAIGSGVRNGADLDGDGAQPGIASGAACTRSGRVVSGAMGNVFVLDVGGGSTEFVYGTSSGEMLWRGSADVGAVRMTELCIKSDPPSELDRNCLAEAVRRKLETLWRQVRVDELTDDPGNVGPTTRRNILIGVGGTVTTLAAIDLQLERYDPDQIHGYPLSFATVTKLLDTLRNSTVAERRSLPGMQARADIIVAGTFIVDYVMRTIGADRLIVSESDLQEGVVLRQAAGESIH